jgi:hypothetical protein
MNSGCPNGPARRSRTSRWQASHQGPADSDADCVVALDTLGSNHSGPRCNGRVNRFLEAGEPHRDA